ncbi:M4 family metallopeptidase, partial [Staphylococcus succinus]
SNPEQYDQPANMSDYYQGTEDEGGVHINSGIPNKAAYLTIKSIGKDKAQQIYYLALTQYLTPNSQFVDAKLALKEAADQLYGDNSTEADAIDKAWNDVGVTE